jgi:hypothetical protein
MPGRRPSAAERGLLNEARILAAAIAGGVLAAPLSRAPQDLRPPRTRPPPPAPPLPRTRADRSRQRVRMKRLAAARSGLPSRWSRSTVPGPGLSRPKPGPVEDAPLGDPALSEPLPPLSGFDVQPAGEEPPPPTRRSESVAGPLHLVVEGMDGDRPRRPLPRPFRARGCRRRGGQRRDDRGARRGGRRARRPPAPLRRLL